MSSEPQRPGSREVHDYTEEYGYHSDQQSLRLRRDPSRVSNQNQPQFDWSSPHEEEDEEGSSGPPRDLRATPLPMALKRAIRQVQQMQVPVVSSRDSWKRKNAKSLRKLKDCGMGFLSFFSLWSKTLQKIGGNFGGGVQSYFLSSCGSWWCSICFLFTDCWIVSSSPSIVSDPSGPHLLTAQVKGHAWFMILILKAWWCSIITSLTYFQERVSWSIHTCFNGYYNNTMVEDKNISYNIPLAYLFTAVFYFVFCLICIIARMGTAARVVVATGSSTVGDYSMIVFTSWDYGCLGDRATKLSRRTSTTSCSICLPSSSHRRKLVVPLLCDQIALIERYSPSTTVIVALLRAVFLRLVSLGVLLFTLWRQITCEGAENTGECKLCQYNHLLYPCWETRVGQEMYKLTLFDFLINIAVLVLVEFPRRMVVDNWSNKLSQWVGRQEFVVPDNVLGLVYGQTVVWTGALFCPLLPLINTLKFILLFYFKKITLFHNCRPALKTFRSTTSTFFFLVVLLFGLGLGTVVMIYSLSEIRPSMGCGPFRFFPSMWSIVPTSFNNLSIITQEFLFFIGSQSFSIPLFALSCVVMCYVVALASVYGKSVALLRAQIKLEGRDKQFLVKQIEMLSRRQQILKQTAGASS
ncbi:hypothetical protein KUCAC02_014205 [Chaenocephalus aceratus]|uniref:Uncharacterized protein n=1 Tax=Chaenocephalus aceratus TaxID=36190 RepID=A0ACB9WDU2_CHAAC|nr:hypothetical protein KUCAC02_014205 [Chaenocephalus aceratus]